jgi:hypothetical protein
LTLKINRIPDSPKDYVCTKFGQNPLRDVDPRVFTRMLRKDGRTEGRTVALLYPVCTKFGQNPLKDVDSSVHKDVMW